MKILNAIDNSIEGELQAYSKHKETIENVDSFDNGILQGRKEFAEELWNLINNKEVTQ